MRCIIFKKFMKANGIATEIDTSYGVMENCIREKDRERKSYDLGLGMG